jgi:hypothetical protein
MEALKTLQKQEQVAHVEHALEAYFIGRNAGEKPC